MADKEKLKAVLQRARQENGAVPGLRVSTFLEAEALLEAVPDADIPIIFMVPADRDHLKPFVQGVRCFERDNLFIQLVGDDPERMALMADDLPVDGVCLMTPVSAAAETLCRRLGGNGVLLEVLLPWRQAQARQRTEGRVVDEDEARAIVNLPGLDVAAVPVGGGPGPYKSWRTPLWSAESFVRVVDMNPELLYALPWGSLLPKSLLNKYNLYGGALPGVVSLPKQQFLGFINAGAVKISFRSDLSLAFLSGLRESLYRRPEKLDANVHLESGKQMLVTFFRERLKEIYP